MKEEKPAVTLSVAAGTSLALVLGGFPGGRGPLQIFYHPPLGVFSQMKESDMEGRGQ